MQRKLCLIAQGLVDFAIGPVNSVINLPNGQVKFFEEFKFNCVRGTRTQPLICVGCSVHYWVTCAINKGGLFEIAFSFVVVDTHLPRFEALA